MFSKLHSTDRYLILLNSRIFLFAACANSTTLNSKPISSTKQIREIRQFILGNREKTGKLDGPTQKANGDEEWFDIAIPRLTCYSCRNCPTRVLFMHLVSSTGPHCHHSLKLIVGHAYPNLIFFDKMKMVYFPVQILFFTRMLSQLAQFPNPTFTLFSVLFDQSTSLTDAGYPRSPWSQSFALGPTAIFCSKFGDSTIVLKFRSIDWTEK